MYFIFYWVCISYFYFVGVHNTPKNGVHGVRRNYIYPARVARPLVAIYTPRTYISFGESDLHGHQKDSVIKWHEITNKL